MLSQNALNEQFYSLETPTTDLVSYATTSLRSSLFFLRYFQHQFAHLIISYPRKWATFHDSGIVYEDPYGDMFELTLLSEIHTMRS